MCNAPAQRHAIGLYDEWWLSKDSGRRGRVLDETGKQVNFTGRVGMEYRIGPVSRVDDMPVFSGVAVRRYDTLDDATGAVRGQLRAMFEAAHAEARDGREWHEHARQAVHLVLEADSGGAEGAGAIGAAAPGGVRASLPPSAWRRRVFLLEHGGGASSARIGVADERGARGGVDAARGRERASGAMEGVGTQGTSRCSEANAQCGVPEGAGRGSGVCEELGGVRRMAMQDE